MALTALCCLCSLTRLRHTVLHDWPDDEARKILECLKPAMFRGYSRLLINESVITTRPKPLTTTSDITMMLMASAWERT